MADYIKKIRTLTGDKQIDYSSLANLPDSLPVVSASDNGKFLRVVDGVWAAEVVINAEEVSY